MRSFRKALAVLAALVLLASLNSATIRTAKAQNSRANFDQKTVAKRYNLVLQGAGTSEENALAAVGWFEADETGVVTSAKISVVVAGATVFTRNQLELLPNGINKITLKDATDGLYELDLFVGHSEAEVRLIGRILLDDPRGRSGKIVSSYSYSFSIPTADQEAGAARGEITAQ